MNCEDYQRAFTADPAESFAGGARHVADCAACQAYRERLRAFDNRLERALRIDVPPLKLPALPPVASAGSSDAVPGPASRSRRFAALSPPLWAGIAAVFFVVALGIAFLGGEAVKSDSLARQVVAHMDHEQASRQVTSVAVPEQRLGDVVNSDVAAMDNSIGLITYAMSCVINGRRVPHLVVQGRSGPVTLILMPDESISDAIPLAGESVHGVILPVGSGSVAIIGEREEQMREVDRIGSQLAASVRWRT
ncbi:MAG: DUF3379 family protein [Woeseia sp.]